MEVLKTIVRVRRRGDVAIVLITHNEVHAKLVADRFTFLALGQVIGRGTRAELEGEDIRDLMAGGRPIGDLARELAAA
jgi:simple sugar transport system ATP-binding protein